LPPLLILLSWDKFSFPLFSWRPPQLVVLGVHLDGFSAVSLPDYTNHSKPASPGCSFKGGGCLVGQVQQPVSKSAVLLPPPPLFLLSSSSFFLKKVVQAHVVAPVNWLPPPYLRES